jgi:hypothetical protein
MDFGSVRDRVVHEIEYVSVGNRIEDRLALPSSFEEPRRQQDLQTGRDRCDLLLLKSGNLADAEFAVGQPHQDTEPAGVGQGFEHLRGCVELMRLAH